MSSTMHRNSVITRSRSRALESSRYNKSTLSTEALKDDIVHHHKGRQVKRPPRVDSKGSSSFEARSLYHRGTVSKGSIEMNKSCETKNQIVTRSRSRLQKSGKCGQPNDNITSESEGEIGHHHVNKRKRPPLIVDSTSESAECPSGESSHLESGKAPDIDTAADFTPTRTLEVSRYGNKHKASYQRIDVCRHADDDDDNSCSTDQDGEDVDRVEVKSRLTPCDEEPISPKAVMPMLPPKFSGGLRQVFEIYLQAMVSGADDPDFLVRIYQKKDDYFLPALNKVDDTLDDRKMFLVKGQAWIRPYKNAVEKYPYMYVENSLAYLGSPCQACGLKDRYASTDVMFGGSPYNRTTMEDLESDEYDCVRREYQDWDIDSDFSDSYKSFEDWFGDYGEYGEIRGEHWYVGRCCYKRSKLYHSLHHYKWSLMKSCKEKVEYHRLVRPQIQKNQLIEVIMDDDSWVESVYNHLKDNLDSIPVNTLVMERTCLPVFRGDNSCSTVHPCVRRNVVHVHVYVLAKHCTNLNCFWGR